tara:strand:- start:48 stop:1121 length:1074 start_codon:yes stop_codon:yes gene_type:complete
MENQDTKYADTNFGTKTSILRILLSVSEVSGPYNQFTFPFAKKQNITLHLLNEPNLKIEEEISCNISHGSYFRFIVSALKEVKKQYDVIHIHHANLAPLAGMVRLIKIRSSSKIIFTLGTCFDNLKWRHKIFLYLSKKYFHHFICCSQSVYNSLPRRFIGDNVTTIRHGINLSRIVSGSNEKKQMVVATRLIEQKNIDLIIRAFSETSELSDYKLIIAGDGASKNYLTELADGLNKNLNIKFVGTCSRNEVLTLMSKSRYYLSASESDGMPIAVLEAVSSGCIPILLNSQPHEEVLKEGIFGFVFEKNDQSLAKILTNCLQYSNDFLNHKSITNLAIAAESFGVDRMMNQYQKLIDS